MKVVAISGVSGCGKTSVIKSLSQHYSCPYLLFDDYTDSDTYPSDMKRWYSLGTNVSDIKTPRLISALCELKESCTNEYIFIEEPFGRCRESIANLIDIVILIDIPMEICLSRVISRNIKYLEADSLTSIPQYLDKYDDYLRHIYIEANNQTRKDSDFVIKELGTIDFVSSLIIDKLKSIEELPSLLSTFNE